MRGTKVRCEVIGHVGWIILQYGKNMNAIDEVMADELLDALARFENDIEIRVMVIASSGGTFSSGGDVRYFYHQLKDYGSIDLSPLLKKVGQLSLALRKSTKMIISSVNGVAAGAGASLALSCDFVICGQSASFIQSFTKIGLVPDAGADYFLPRAIGPQRAMEYCILATPMPAEVAKNLGLVYLVAPDSELSRHVQALAYKLAAGPLAAYSNLKKQIFDSCFSEYERYLEGTEAHTQIACSRTGDFKEGVCAFIEKRAPSFEGK